MSTRWMTFRWGWWWAGWLGVGLVALVWPAAWLVGSVSEWTHQRVQLVEAQGPWWQGSALVLLSGGAGSTQTTLLPARLHWQTEWGWGELRLHLFQENVTPERLTLRVRPHWDRLELTLDPITQPLQWPVDWLQGLGAPWNTFKLGGWLDVHSEGGSAVIRSKGWTLQGGLTLTLRDLQSPLAQVPRLGSYQVQLRAQGAEPIQVRLQTLHGPLSLDGQGHIGPRGLRLRAHVEAEPAQADALKNLLNLIGPRQGAGSTLSIG